MRKSAAAHLGLDLDPQTVPPIDHHPHQRGIDQIHQQQPNRGQYGQPQVAKRQQVIDEGGDGKREGKLQQAGQHSRAEVHPEQARVGTIVFEKLAEHKAGFRMNMVGVKSDERPGWALCR